MAVSSAFKALGDSTRMAIFEYLLERPRCTRFLSRRLGITESAVSQHLKVLLDAGLVERRRCGRHMHYLPVQATLDALAAEVTEMCERSRELGRDAVEHPCGCKKAAQ